MKRPQFAHEKSHQQMINVNGDTERKRDGNQSKNDLRLQNESESTYSYVCMMCILGRGLI